MAKSGYDPSQPRDEDGKWTDSGGTRRNAPTSRSDPHYNEWVEQNRKNSMTKKEWEQEQEYKKFQKSLEAARERATAALNEKKRQEFEKRVAEANKREKEAGEKYDEQKAFEDQAKKDLAAMQERADAALNKKKAEAAAAKEAMHPEYKAALEAASKQAAFEDAMELGAGLKRPGNAPPNLNGYDNKDVLYQIRPGDKVDFGALGKFYVQGWKGSYFFVTKSPKARLNADEAKNNLNDAIHFSDAKKILEKYQQ